MVRVRIAVNDMGENDATALMESDALGDRDGEPLIVNCVEWETVIEGEREARTDFDWRAELEFDTLTVALTEALVVALSVMRGVGDRDRRADWLSVDAKVGCELIEEEPDTRGDTEGEVLIDGDNDDIEDTLLANEKLDTAVELGLIDDIEDEDSETVGDIDAIPEIVMVTILVGEDSVVPVGVDIELGEIVE